MMVGTLPQAGPCARWWLVFTGLLGAGCHHASTPSACDGGTALPDGPRRVALVAGVGGYSQGITRLEGTVSDAEEIAALLQGSYGMTPEATCMLKDPSVDTFRAAWQAALVDRVRGPEDVAVIYFAGHGTQLKEQEEPFDEPDGLDEALVFADAARTGGRGGVLLDDELQLLLGQVTHKTSNVTLIVDACHSGSITRSSGSPRFTEVELVAPLPVRGQGDGAQSWTTAGEAVVITAAADDEQAREGRDGGTFTTALVGVLAGGGLPSWRSVEERVRRSITQAGTAQHPTFLGSLDEAPFGVIDPPAPSGWRVVEVDDREVVLDGLPATGIGPGATVWMGTGQEARQICSVTSAQGWRVRCTADGTGAQVGMLAWLRTPAAAPIVVDLIDVGAGALSSAQRARLLDVFNSHPGLVEPKVGSALRVQADGQDLVLLDADDRERRRSTGDSAACDILGSLTGLGRQQAFLALRSVGGPLVDDAALEVRFVLEDGTLLHGSPGRPVSVPDGTWWRVEARLADAVPQNVLLAGALLLSSDGGIAGLPRGGQTAVKVGHAWTSLDPASARHARGGPPYGVADQVMVFGFEPTETGYDWSSADWNPTCDRGGVSSLVTAMEGLVRGSSPARVWTSSVVSLVVERERP